MRLNTGRRRSELRGLRGRITRFKIGISELLAPRVAIGCIDAKGFAGSTDDFVLLKDDMILECPKCATVGVKRRGHCAIPGEAPGLLIVTCIDGVGLQLGRQSRKFIPCAAMPDDQTRTSATQRYVHLRHGLMDELDTAIGPISQRIEDIAVEAEGSIDAVGVLQGPGEYGLIFQPKIATKPHEYGFHDTAQNFR